MPSLQSAAWVLGVAALALSSGDQSRPAEPPPPAVTEFVDFVAIGEGGHPVADLAAAEVSLKVDGRPRAIKSLERIELAGGGGDAPIGEPIPAPFGTNRLSDAGRLVLIVIDHESIRPGKERPAKDAALRFLRGLSPRDRVGLLTMPHGWSIEPTTNHDKVREALPRVTGQWTEITTDSESLCHARLALTTLTGMLESLALTGGPKTIAFISSGLRGPNRDGPMNRAPGQCEVRSVYYEEVALATSNARAHFYVIQPSDEQHDSAKTALADPEASRFAASDENLAGLQHLASVTGGRLFRLNSQQPDVVFTQIAEESAAYYMIGFDAEPAERNGLAHRVEIRVSRERVTVRSTPTLTIAKPDVRGDLTPQKMLRTGRRFHELPLRATAYAARMPDQTTLKIIAAAEPMDASVPLKSAAFGLFDAKGKLAAQSSADGKELAALPFIAALPGPTGPYTLRVAAVDARGRPGTVDYPFRAELTTASGPSGMKFSGLALGVSRNGSFAPRLQFGSDPQAVALFEMYGTPPRGAELTVRMEIARSSEEPPLVGVSAGIRPGAQDDSRMVVAALPISTLFPGDYVVRAIVNVDGRPVARILRTLRKVNN